MPNETIGKIRCPFTGEMGEIRKAKRGKHPLYFTSKAGIVQPKSQAFQDYIKKNGEFESQEETFTESVTESPKVSQKPEKEEKPRSWLDDLLGGDDD